MSTITDTLRENTLRETIARLTAERDQARNALIDTAAAFRAVVDENERAGNLPRIQHVADLAAAERLIAEFPTQAAAPSPRQPGRELPVQAGQVYASTHRGDVSHGRRQRRRVVRVDGAFAWLVSEDAEGVAVGPETRVRLRNGKLPGHRLRSGASGSAPLGQDAEIG